ncbi:germination protein KA [Polycladomyces abyssicola]|uniref:Germination protein KA n=1 Tax=Polycladomyces abyssicola TaxID=1125966 RepID=A0A8D5ZKY1_9BACL|nr:germination protein KA [Polycladomyces abyssicola]
MLFFRSGKNRRRRKKQLPKREKQPVFPMLEENLRFIQEMLFHTNDLRHRTITFQGKQMMILYLESLADTDRIEKEILFPIVREKEGDVQDVITSAHVEKQEDLRTAVDKLVQGQTVMIMEGDAVCYVMDTRSLHKRDMKEPDNERVVRGPHNGFVENLTVNLYQLRTRIENRHLVVRYYNVGKETKTKIAIVYMENLVNPDLIKEVDKRIRSISTDTILNPGYIQEFMEDDPWSPFPQSLNTERPDRAMAHLMEGRVVLLSEGDPTALIMPVTLFAFYQSPDDFHSRWWVGSFVRMIRFASFLVAFQLPAIYIAVVSFHAEVLPVDLVYTLKATLDRVPYPPILEALLMELSLELIREAGIRLPSPVGQTIGIVGGLVMGDAVVRAGLVSYTMVIVVALTAISSFVVPSNEMSTSIRILRFPMMIAASMFGFVGIVFGTMAVLIHLTKLVSFGTPYFSPVAPMRLKDMQDTILRMPIWKMNQRPHDPHPQRMKREDDSSRRWKKDDQGKQ